MRFELDLYVNLRPFSAPADIDMVVIRENTEGVYAGEGGFPSPGDATRGGHAGLGQHSDGGERCVRFAFELAEERPARRLTLVHKTNVLTHAGDLWPARSDDVATDHRVSPRV